MQTRPLFNPRSLLRLLTTAAALALFSIPASAQYPSFFTAKLSGTQQSPPNASPGTAFGRVTIYDESPAFPSMMLDVKVKYSIAYSGLRGDATWIEVYEQAGAPGTVPILRLRVAAPGGTSGFVRNQERTISKDD